MEIIRPEDFPHPWLRIMACQTRKEGNQGTSQRKRYKDIVTAFDIETTRIPEIEQSVMYIWQWAFGDRLVVVGRTWDEYLAFVEELRKDLQLGEWLVVYVHNLSFEFEYLRGIYEFAPGEVFAIKSRKILKATMYDKLELRCSYLHSNMSLDVYCQKMHVEHKKLTYDYNRQRWPWTPLTDDELAYCVNDVIGLVEALHVEMQHDGDNLYSIPMTSTGYVRRDAKRAMRKFSRQFVTAQLPDIDIYNMLREAFRGGNTHASRFYAEQIVHDVHSADRSSSYPDVLCNCKFPIGPFFREREPMEYDEVLKLITVRKKAVLMRCRIFGLQLRDPLWGCPYLSRNKCRDILSGSWDNGRILSARYLETTLTDIDLQIVAEEYTWTDIKFFDVAHARYGMLPDVLKECIIGYYRDKTILKGDPEQDVFYTKQKNKLNSIYGMMGQNPVRRPLVYTHYGKYDQYGQINYYPEDDTVTDEDLLTKHNRTAFLCYQWGVWTTAWARFRLEEGIRLAHQDGAEFLYCDTDSVKYIGTINWTAYNQQRIEDSTRSGAYAVDHSGETHYMGVFEQEHDMLEFCTLGSKKYVYTIPASKKYKRKHPDRDVELVCTVAGVGKTAGAEELLAAGGVKAFKDGFVFHEAGGLEAIYNDAPEITSWTVDGHTIAISSNVTLRPSSYTLGLSRDYWELLHGIRYQAIEN